MGHPEKVARPDIVIRAGDEDKLAALAGSLLDSAPALGEALLDELARAQVASDDAALSSTVQMGSTLTYEVGGQRRRVTLVYPPEADIDSGRISVGTPIGAALIGLAEGQSIDWTARDGRRQRLTVVAVERPAGR